MNYIRYSTVGGARKRNDEVGDDFIQAEPDEYDNDAPKLMTYTATSLSKRNTNTGGGGGAADLLEMTAPRQPQPSNNEPVPKLQPPKHGGHGGPGSPPQLGDDVL